MSNAKTYQVTVSKTLPDGTTIQKTYNKHYYVMSEEDKLNKLRACRTAKLKLLTEIRKKLKDFENNYDALDAILKGLNDLKTQIVVPASEPEVLKPDSDPKSLPASNLH